MAGTKEGAAKARDTTKQRYGKKFYAEIGSRGGSKPTDKPKGFAAATEEQRREWGRLGGKKSRRYKVE